MFCLIMLLGGIFLLTANIYFHFVMWFPVLCFYGACVYMCASHTFYMLFSVCLVALILLICFLFASLFPKGRELDEWGGGRIWAR